MHALYMTVLLELSEQKYRNQWYQASVCENSRDLCQTILNVFNQLSYFITMQISRLQVFPNLR